MHETGQAASFLPWKMLREGLTLADDQRELAWQWGSQNATLRQTVEDHQKAPKEVMRETHCLATVMMQVLADAPGEMEKVLSPSS